MLGDIIGQRSELLSVELDRKITLFLSTRSIAIQRLIFFFCMLQSVQVFNHYKFPSTVFNFGLVSGWQFLSVKSTPQGITP
jgi:hypothetical protein